MDVYTFGLKGRKVSLVLRLTDAVTGKLPQGKIFLRVNGREGIFKSEGLFVFTDLPGLPWRVQGGGDMFLPVDIELNNPPAPPIYGNVILIPGCRYRLSKGSPYVSVNIERIGLSVLGKPLESSIRLKNMGDDFIEIDRDDCNPAGRMLGFFEGERITASFIPGETIEAGKYRLSAPLGVSYPRGTVIYPLSPGVTRETGDLFLPLWGIKGNQTHVGLYLRETGVFISEAPVILA